MKERIRILFAVILVLQSVTVFSQNKIGVKVGVDLVNRYLWRGIENGLGFDGSKSIQIQPTLVGSYKNFEVGYWGSFGVSNRYSEYDLWVKYSLKQFSVSVFDYNQSFEDENGTGHGGYFNVPFNSPGSFAEVTLAYDGGDKFPLYASYNRFFYNDDATYLELGYRFNTNKLFPMNVTLGGIPAANSYGENAGIVNMIYKVEYDIKFSPKFKVPVFASVVENPQAEKTYFVFGLTFSKN
jgi:hypothetical protein